MSAFPDLGHTMLRELGRAFPAEKEDIGADARLKKGPFRLETESYRLPGLGHYCILRMTALLGLMKMETLVLAPTERDLPLLNLDRVRVLGKDGEVIELKDDDDDDFTPTFGSVERSSSDDREFESSGYSVEEIDESQLDLDFEGDDDYTNDTDEGEGDF